METGVSPGCSLCLHEGLRYCFRKAEHRFYECPTCLHVRVYPYPESEATSAHYEQSYSPEYLTANSKWFQVLAETRMEIIGQCFPPGFQGSVLDVGAGYGFFLKEAERRGWEPRGIETSPAEADHAKREFSLPILRLDAPQALAQLANEPELFDVITFWHVLEHLEIPGPVIQAAAQLLTSNGILIVNSPNLDSTVFQLLRQRWTWIYVPGHLQYFRLNPLVAWLERDTPLSVAKFETWTHAPNLYFMIEEATLLGFADLLDYLSLRRFSGRLRGFVYGTYNHQVIQQYFRKLYDLTPFLDRRLLARNRGHEFLIVARKKEDMRS